MFDNIFRPIAIVLGKFMDLIFTGMDNIGIGNIGIAIIIFTIIVKVAMMPLIFSQQKTVKVTQIMQPEIKAIRAKYKGRNDNESMQMQNQEIKEVYAKYGASQTGGCIQLLIQLPILLALYQVFRFLPIHLVRLNEKLTDILKSINTDGDFLSKMTDNFGGINWNIHDDAVSGLNAFTAEKWTKLQELFPQSANVIAENSEKVLSMNNFLGVHVAIEPGTVMGLAILVPILAGISQFISARLAQNVQGDDRAAKIQAILMSTMMPIISVVFAFRVPAGLGIYWITTAVIQTIMQLIINRYYRDMSPETIKAKAEEKRLKKLEKKAQRQGVDTETFIRNATINTKRIGKAKGDVDPYANATFKERATLSKTPPKIKAKNVKPFSTAPVNTEPVKEKKGLFGKSKTDDTNIKNKSPDRTQQKKSENTVNTAKTAVKNAGDKAKDTVKGAGSKTKDASKAVADKAKDAGKAAGDKAKDTANAVKTKAKKEGGKSLAEMANKVQEFNESSKGKKGKK